MTIAPANSRPFIVNLTATILFREILAPVLYIDIPVAVFHENRNIFMAKIPPDIVVILFIFRRLYRQRKIPTAKPRAIPTLLVFAITANPK